jgi:hypothetical protein
MIFAAANRDGVFFEQPETWSGLSGIDYLRPGSFDRFYVLSR